MSIGSGMKSRRRGNLGFTLAEVLMSLTIAGIALAGIVSGYILAAQRAEWSSAATAAQAQALRRMEQVRAAWWDPFNPSYPTNANQLVATNFPDLAPEPLDIPQNAGFVLLGTNHVTITDLTSGNSTTGTNYLKMIRVDCVSSMPTRGPFTNTVITYRTADQ